MNTHVEYDPREGVYNVWAWIRRGPDTFALEYGPVPGREGALGLRWDDSAPIPFGTSLRDTTPTIVLDHEIVEALLENHEPGLNPKNALAEHLKDARQVRDRMLDLIERGYPGYLKP